jgi:hypothetical protein
VWRIAEVGASVGSTPTSGTNSGTADRGTGGGLVLTDDLNPSDLWAERIDLVARKDLHRRFGIGSW